MKPHFSISQQWSDLFRACNWYDFDLIHIGVDLDRTIGELDFAVALFGVRLSFGVYWDTAAKDRMVNELASIQEARHD